MKLGKQPFNEVDDRACCEHDRDHCSSRDHNYWPASRFVLHRCFLTHFDEGPHTRVQWLGKGRARYHTRIAESAATARGGTHRERNRGNWTLGEMVRGRERSDYGAAVCQVSGAGQLISKKPVSRPMPKCTIARDSVIGLVRRTAQPGHGGYVSVATDRWRVRARRGKDRPIYLVFHSAGKAPRICC